MAKTGSVLTEGKLYDDVVFVDSPDDADMEVLYDKIEYDFEHNALLYMRHGFLVATGKAT
jgi:ketol-acid reductoisomerase